MLLTIGSDVYFHVIVSLVKVVRSDQGGSRNLFSAKTQILLFVLLLSLMIVNISAYTKVQTTKVTKKKLGLKMSEKTNSI